MRVSFERVRTVVLLVLGVAVISWQVFVEKVADPAFLLVGLGLCGLPTALNLDKVLASVIQIEPKEPVK